MIDIREIEPKDRIMELKTKLRTMLYSDKNFEMAESLCTEIIGINPYETDILLKRTLIRENRNKDKEALEDINVYLHIYPFNLEAYCTQARLLTKLQKYIEAIKTYEFIFVFEEDELLKEEYENTKQLLLKQRKRTKKKERRSQNKERILIKGETEARPGKWKIINDEIMLSDEEPDNLPRGEEQKQALVVNPLAVFPQITPGHVSEPYDSPLFMETLATYFCNKCVIRKDFTIVCSHYPAFSEAHIVQLKKMNSVARNSDLKSKEKGFNKVTKNLEILSSRRETAICILNSSFSSILLPYFNGSFDNMFHKSGFSCSECVGTVSPSVHGLIIVGRATKFVLDTHTGYLDSEGDCKLDLDQNLLASIIDLFVPLATEFTLSVINNNFDLHIAKGENIKKLGLSLRAIANLVALEINYLGLALSSVIIKFICNMLEALVKSAEREKHMENRWTETFILHSFRLIQNMGEWMEIESIRREFLQSGSKLLELCKLYMVVGAMMPPLLHILKSIVQIVEHSEHGGSGHSRHCEMNNFIAKTAAKHTQNAYEQHNYMSSSLKEIAELNACAYCKKGTFATLKLCSRCKKVLYCNKDCQKAHYQMHKPYCKPILQTP